MATLRYEIDGSRSETLVPAMGEYEANCWKDRGEDPDEILARHFVTFFNEVLRDNNMELLPEYVETLKIFDGRIIFRKKLLRSVTGRVRELLLAERGDFKNTFLILVPAMKSFVVIDFAQMIKKYRLAEDVDITQDNKVVLALAHDLLAALMKKWRIGEIARSSGINRGI